MKSKQAFTRGLAMLGLLLAPGLALAAVPAGAPNAGAAYSPKGADTCLSCHDDTVVTDVFHTAHGRPKDARTPFGAGQLQCEACHGRRATTSSASRKARAPAGDPLRPRLRDARRRAERDVPRLPREEHRGAMAHRSARHQQRLVCVVPRQPHEEGCRARRADAARRVLHLPRGRESQFLKPYSHPVRQGKLGCSDCHAPHGTTAEKQLVRSTLNETCYECHAEKRGPMLWEHEPVTEDCASCHAPHGSIHPGMVKQRGPILCQSCHSQQGHPSLAYGPSGLPGGSAPATASRSVTA